MIALPKTLRLFPLGEVVHFPDTNLPLHIFEPRYRALLTDALEGDNLVAMVLRKSDPTATDSDVTYQVGCAGRVTDHQQLPDGRSNLVLQGVAKFRITAELPSSKPYRVVEAQGLYEAPPTPEQTRDWTVQLREHLDRLVAVLGGDADGVEKLFQVIPGPALVNALCAALPLSVVEKQGLLECATIEARFSSLLGSLRFKEAEARLGLDATRHVDA